MKHPLRNINVGGEDYKWAVTSYNCDGDGGKLLKIWKDKIPIVEKLTHVAAITPAIVEWEILSAERRRGDLMQDKFWHAVRAAEVQNRLAGLTLIRFFTRWGLADAKKYLRDKNHTAPLR